MPEVVTAFLRHRGEVLLVRRSDTVGTYAGLWGAVSGYVETDDPETDAEREIHEETGLTGVELVRRGDPLCVRDGDREWTVHPFLYDVEAGDVPRGGETEPDRPADAHPSVDPNEELADHEWVSPTAILDRETVPGLWAAYRRVAPTPATVRDDDEHGSAYLSARALAVLRDAAAAAVDGRDDAGGWDDVAALAREVRTARPAMAAVSTRVDRAMSRADGDLPALAAVAEEELARALDADDRAAARAADLLSAEGVERVLTLSRSGTVLAALERTDASVLVAESRPGGEGVGVAEELADAGREVTIAPDAAVGHLFAAGEADALVVGADAILPDGSVVNKVGTRLAALAAAREGLPCYVVAARDKVTPAPDNGGAERGQRAGDGEPNGTVDGPGFDPGSVPREAVYDGDRDLGVATPLFDRTPPDLLAGVVTDEVSLDADEVRRVAAEHRALAAWTRE